MPELISGCLECKYDCITACAISNIRKRETGCSPIIRRADRIFASLEEGYSGISYVAEANGLYFYYKDADALIALTPGGGLKAEGCEGMFYRVGLGKGAPSRFAPYLGDWENEAARLSLSIQEGGYFLGVDDMSMSMGGCSISEDGTLMLGDDQSVTKNADGTLSVSGIEGTFIKTGEYTPPLLPSLRRRPSQAARMRIHNTA